MSKLGRETKETRIVANVRPGTGRTDDPSLVGQRTYTVQQKDSYWSIAEKTMGSGAKFKKLFETNQGRLDLNSIDDPLKPGMVLVIPRD